MRDTGLNWVQQQIVDNWEKRLKDVEEKFQGFAERFRLDELRIRKLEKALEDAVLAKHGERVEDEEPQEGGE